MVRVTIDVESRIMEADKTYQPIIEHKGYVLWLGTKTKHVGNAQKELREWLEAHSTPSSTSSAD